MMKRNRNVTVSTLLAVAMVTFVFRATSANAGESQLISALTTLTEYVNGTTSLSASQIAAYKVTIDDNRAIFGDRDTIISASFNLVASYDSRIGPLWTAGSPTVNGFTRDSVTNDIHWTMFNVMQNIMDDTYTASNLQAYPSLVGGYKFGSSEYFPGHVDPPSNPNTTYTVSIDGSFLDTYGRDTMHWTPEMNNPPRPESAARKATGTYLAPGSVATITVPASLVNQGYVIRVGGNSWDYSNRNPVKRLDRVSLTYAIDSTEVKVASPLGGNIYIEVPFEADAGVVSIDIRNVVRSPFFSMQDHNTTTLTEWRTIERNNLAPWADFQSEKFNLQVPTGWIYALNDPVTLMENWDKALDVTNDLMGFPRDRGKETLFDQVDIIIRSGAYAPGYPTVNNTYSPLRNNDASDYNTAGNAYTGNQGSYLVQGPNPASEVEFHELGHAYLFPKLPGETESVVNLLHVAVFNQAFGYDLEYSFRTSCRGFANNPHRSLDNTAVAWMASFSFVNKRPMDQLEKQYQLKGHAKFVEVARLFGWDKLGDYFGTFNEDYEALGYTPSYGIDDHLLRLSKAVGADITPLFHFYGVHPQNLTSLQAALVAADVPESQDIYDLLVHYKTLVPADNAEFRQYCLDWWGKQPSATGYWTESEHAKQWDATYGTIYNEGTASAIQAVIDELLDLYFPSPFVGFPLGDLNKDDLVDGLDWQMFIAGNQANMSGLTRLEGYALGDLDGDGDNDIYDFAKFRAAYELYHLEQGAFAAMVASNVPEPGSMILLAAGAAGLAMRRRRRERKAPTAHERRSRKSVGETRPEEKVRTAKYSARSVWTLAVVAMASLALPAGPASAEITFDGVTTGIGPGSAGLKTLQVGFDASTADKLVVVIGGEHGFSGNIGGDFFSMTYGGVELTRAVHEGTGIATLGIFYLDSPGDAGDLIVNQANHNSSVYAIYLLSGTAPGVGATNQDTDNSAALTTTAVNSLVIAGILDAGPAGGNGAPNLTVVSPLIEDTPDLYGGGAGKRWVSLSSGHATVATPGAGTYSFSGAGATDALAIGAAAFAPGAPPRNLILQVDTVTGATSILGDPTRVMAINYYEVTSAGDSLDAVKWSSLADQDFEGSGAPNGTGNGWEEAGGVGKHALAEAFLLGDSTIGASQSVSLGMGYDAGVGAEDLVFTYRTDAGAILNGLVEYVTLAGPGDANLDGVVDAADFIALKRSFGKASGATYQDGDFDRDRAVDRDDLVILMGSFSQGAGAATIPEPATMSLVGIAGLALLRRRVAASPRHLRLYGKHNRPGLCPRRRLSSFQSGEA